MRRDVEKLEKKFAKKNKVVSLDKKRLRQQAFCGRVRVLVKPVKHRKNAGGRREYLYRCLGCDKLEWHSKK